MYGEISLMYIIRKKIRITKKYITSKFEVFKFLINIVIAYANVSAIVLSLLAITQAFLPLRQYPHDFTWHWDTAPLPSVCNWSILIKVNRMKSNQYLKDAIIKNHIVSRGFNGNSKLAGLKQKFIACGTYVSHI